MLETILHALFDANNQPEVSIVHGKIQSHSITLAFKKQNMNA